MIKTKSPSCKKKEKNGKLNPTMYTDNYTPQPNGICSTENVKMPQKKLRKNDPCKKHIIRISESLAKYLLKIVSRGKVIRNKDLPNF